MFLISVGTKVKPYLIYYRRVPSVNGSSHLGTLPYLIGSDDGLYSQVVVDHLGICYPRSTSGRGAIVA